MSASAAGPSTVGFTGATAASQHRLFAFTNGGSLLGRDAGVDVRVAAVDAAAGRLTFQYKMSYSTSYSAEVVVAYGGAYSDRGRAYQLRPAPSGGAPAADSGVYVFFALRAGDVAGGGGQAVWPGDAYRFNVSNNEGKGWRAGDGGSAHAVVECAARGLCDRATGACACATGYTGDACQRAACPAACSGNGQCTTQKNLVEEGTLGAAGYAAADGAAQAGCRCDAGFRGADCSLRECPSGDDPLGGDGGAQGRDCSGRGGCDYATGQCACYGGYAGEGGGWGPRAARQHSVRQAPPASQQAARAATRNFPPPAARRAPAHVCRRPLPALADLRLRQARPRSGPNGKRRKDSGQARPRSKADSAVEAQAD